MTHTTTPIPDASRPAQQMPRCEEATRVLGSEVRTICIGIAGHRDDHQDRYGRTWDNDEWDNDPTPDRANLDATALAAAQRVELIDVVAVDVCKSGGHIPNRDRSLPGSCNFHRATAARYVDMVLVAIARRPVTAEVI